MSLENLLEPIREDSPVGDNLEADTSAVGLHWKITDARTKAFESDDENDWAELADLCEDALGTQSKNLLYVALLARASVSLDGYGGLADCAELASGLLDRYGLECFPPPDEYDEFPGENTILPLQQLETASMLTALRRVPLTESQLGGPFELWHYQEAQRIATASYEEQQAYAQQDLPSLDTVRESATATTISFLQETRASIVRARESMDALKKAINDAVGKHVANFRKIDEILEESDTALEDLAGSRLEAAEAQAESETAADGAADGGAAAAPGAAAQPAVVVGSIASREDAFRVLGDVAQYFEKTEPQSLLPAQIRRVVKWGRMDPAALYAELIDESHVKDQLFRLVGLEDRPDGGGDDGYGPG